MHVLLSAGVEFIICIFVFFMFCRPLDRAQEGLTLIKVASLVTSDTKKILPLNTSALSHNLFEEQKKTIFKRINKSSQP